MSASVLYMSMSLDGYIAGPNDKPGNPGGDGFGRLHEWYGDSQLSGARPSKASEEFLDEMNAARCGTGGCCSAVATGCSSCCGRVSSWRSSG